MLSWGTTIQHGSMAKLSVESGETVSGMWRKRVAFNTLRVNPSYLLTVRL
jgi:hypothetical protein